VLAGNKLWLANSKGDLQGYDPRNGKLTDTQSTSGPVFVPMLGANRTLYILSDDGTLSAYR
jgi:outer membrane protein assembly factor BamB